MKNQPVDDVYRYIRLQFTYEAIETLEYNCKSSPCCIAARGAVHTLVPAPLRPMRLKRRLIAKVAGL